MELRLQASFDTFLAQNNDTIQCFCKHTITNAYKFTNPFSDPFNETNMRFITSAMRSPFVAVSLLCIPNVFKAAIFQL